MSNNVFKKVETASAVALGIVILVEFIGVANQTGSVGTLLNLMKIVLVGGVLFFLFKTK